MTSNEMDLQPYRPRAFSERLDDPPPLLFHYTGQAGLLGIVERAELWATKIQYMNDATEFGLALQMARFWLDEISKNTGLASEKAACTSLRQSLDGLEDINIFAICFCEKPDLLSQWRGYSGGDCGYAIAFDSSALAKIADSERFSLGPCIYDQNVQNEIVREAIRHCIDDELGSSLARRRGFHGPLADVLFRCGAFFKDKSFEEEREWRLVSPTIRYSNEKLRFRTGTSMITPFFALPIRGAGPLPIPYVVVGPCPHVELAKSAVTSLLMRNGLIGPLNGQQIAFASMIPFRNW
jgi:hypothetical protein